eukprot:Clim_evm57s210 gene=Clim_evmTU57s210
MKYNIGFLALTASAALAVNPEIFYQPQHHDQVELEVFLNSVSDNYPNITRLYSVGSTGQSRNMWVVQISKNPQAEQRELLVPQFKYIGNMHGDEVVSREILMTYIKHLVENYGIDKRVTWLVDNTDIHIMPTMNPDGYERWNKKKPEFETKSSCMTVFGRGNANGVDLNRNFPGRFKKNSDPEDTIQIETQNVMDWINENDFVLSANLHGGCLVANYPWDDYNRGTHHDGPNPAPDINVFRDLALTYSQNHPVMKTGIGCGPGEGFKDGITNGADWYSVANGMQDWNYVNSNCFEITVEVATCKIPKKSDIGKFWELNKESLLAYNEYVHNVVYGLVKDKDGNPLKDTEILVSDTSDDEWISHAIRSNANGEYWRLVKPEVDYKVGLRVDGKIVASTDAKVIANKEKVRIDWTAGEDGSFKAETKDPEECTEEPKENETEVPEGTDTLTPISTPTDESSSAKEQCGEDGCDESKAKTGNEPVNDGVEVAPGGSDEYDPNNQGSSMGMALLIVTLLMVGIGAGMFVCRRVQHQRYRKYYAPPQQPGQHELRSMGDEDVDEETAL